MEEPISDSLDSVLGLRIMSAEARTYKVDDLPPEQLDLAEVLLVFDGKIERFFSWEQREDNHELSVRTTSHLLPDVFDEGSPAMKLLLSDIIDKRLTAYELFADEWQNVVSVRLSFEERACVISVGHDVWNEKEHKVEFSHFSGDDLFLWSDEIFESTAKLRQLDKVVSKSARVT